MQRCHAGSLHSLEDAINAAVAAQRLAPADSHRDTWQKALEPLRAQLEAHCAPCPELSNALKSSSQVADALFTGPKFCVTVPRSMSTPDSSSIRSLFQALETAWAIGLQDNAVAALETLLRWCQDAQQAQHVMTVDLSRHPDSLPWDCGMDSTDPDPWAHPEHDVPSSPRASQHTYQHCEDQFAEGVGGNPPVLDLLQAVALSGHNSPNPVRWEAQSDVMCPCADGRHDWPCGKQDVELESSLS